MIAYIRKHNCRNTEKYRAGEARNTSKKVFEIGAIILLYNTGHKFIIIHFCKKPKETGCSKQDRVLRYKNKMNRRQNK